MARDIYYQYTDLVEPFGLDENWLDLSGSIHLHGGGLLGVAREISERIKAELGVTVSIGASWNKILAKFGSDYKKPDAITVIDKNNFEKLFWEAPVEELLYVGRATQKKLNASAVFTIKELAHTSDAFLQQNFGKIGFMLRAFARGEDVSPVKPYDPETKDVNRSIKSYGNGLTAPHDITCELDAKALLYLLAESVGQRLREDGMRGKTIAIMVRDGETLSGFTRQMKLKQATASTKRIAENAWHLLLANQALDEDHPVRALMVRVSSLEPMHQPHQLSLFEKDDTQLEQLDFVIDDLRRRYGNTCVQRGIELADKSLRGVDIKGENTVHPVGYLHT
jgi:DNA polymerase-4